MTISTTRDIIGSDCKVNDDNNDTDNSVKSNAVIRMTINKKSNGRFMKQKC